MSLLIARICYLLLLLPVLSFAQGSFTTDPFASNSGEEDFLPVEQAYQLTVSDEQDQLKLTWNIAPGYYLYQHGFKAHVDGNNLLAEAQIPAGIAKIDEYFGEVEVYYHNATLALPSPDSDNFVLAVQSQGCADAGLCYPPYKQYFAISADGVQELNGPPDNILAPSAEPAQQASMTLLLAVVFAFFGGMILNLMPCVLPVLSLKVIGLSSSHEDRKRRIAHGWSYTLGVVGSFCLVAAVLISLKAAGTAVGWGFQLQNPWFVGFLIYLFFTLALLLIGAADFSGQWMGFGQSLANGGGLRGSFFTGVLAVLVASPCTAPFMGTAMGFATTQPAAIALAVFAALGLGMAFPFLLLSYLPGLSRWLPKPGAWMERFKEFLAFPLLATAIWLLWVIGGQTGPDGIAIVLGGCLLITIALWLRAAGPFARFARLGLAVCAIALLGVSQLNGGAQSADHEGSWSEERVQALRSEGRPVFVNFTADWCVTCLANERLALSTDEVKNAFEANNVAYLKADWTSYDPEISDALERFGRSGIPLYLFYPAGSDGEPEILPQILTRDILLETLRL